MLLREFRMTRICTTHSQHRHGPLTRVHMLIPSFRHVIRAAKKRWSILPVYNTLGVLFYGAAKKDAQNKDEHTREQKGFDYHSEDLQAVIEFVQRLKWQKYNEPLRPRFLNDTRLSVFVISSFSFKIDMKSLYNSFYFLDKTAAIFYLYRIGLRYHSRRHKLIRIS